MKFTPTAIKSVVVIEPKVFEDHRGFFMETWRRDAFAAHGIDADFVQINHSQSIQHTLRGLHYQVAHPQAKLVRVLRGEVFDVAVDIRFGSPTFGQWVGEVLSARNKKQLFVPVGFAHGFCVLSEEAEFIYYCTDYYHPPGERGVIWDDPDLAIPWPAPSPLLSAKDRQNPRLRDIGRDFTYNC